MRCWSVVVPAKRLAVAKTRLAPLTGALGGLPGAAHAELVLALLADTVTAALAADGVAEVVVVTDDPAAAEVATAIGARTVPDEPGRGLNPALAHGAEAARHGTVAALSSDLPALRPDELGAALQAALAPRCFVADAAGTGTTLLTARGVRLDPGFGRGSARRHRDGGALELAGAWPGLARDVDTAEDLGAAGALGLGRRTAAVLAARRVAARP